MTTTEKLLKEQVETWELQLEALRIKRQSCNKEARKRIESMIYVLVAVIEECKEILSHSNIQTDPYGINNES